MARRVRTKLCHSLGVYDEKVVKLTRCHKSATSRNHSRAMHRMIHREDKTLPVDISAVDVKVKVPRRRKVLIKPWPVISLTSWARLCFENVNYNGYFLLGGQTLDDWDSVQVMLGDFWDRFKHMDSELVPTHPAQTVPIYIHGDEGRGLVKRPLLIISYQPAMSWAGALRIPSTKHLYKMIVKQ